MRTTRGESRSPKIFRVEVRDKQVFDIIADGHGILSIIASEQHRFTRNTGKVNWCESSQGVFTDQLRPKFRLLVF